MSFSHWARSLRQSATILSVILFTVVNLHSFTGQAHPHPRNGSLVERRIQRIQEGLLPPVLIKGESAQTKKLTDRMSALHVPGASVAVIHNGKVDWTRGFGVAKMGGPPISPKTLFQAASISKSLTSMAVLHLVQLKKLDLDADVNQYLKAWKMPPSSFSEQSKVTLRRLWSQDSKS
jgi:CubicO group peptidase (beta-lactamase class C family)